MTISDPVAAELMAAGAPFEVNTQQIGDHQVKLFKNAPKNLCGVFDAARAFGDQEFIVHGDERLTFNEFLDRSDRLASWLLTKGVKPGDKVAIAAINSAFWMIAFGAVMRVGAIAVLVNSRAEPAVINAAVEDSDCQLLLCDERRLKALRSEGCNLPALSREKTANADFFEDALKTPLAEKFPEIDSDDDAAMFFTSGTTGRAKAAVVTHRALSTGTMNTKLAMEVAFSHTASNYGMTLEAFREMVPQRVNLLIFPLFHTSGCNAIFLTSLSNGSKLVLMDRWNAEAALSLIEGEGVTTIGGVPAMYWDILSSSKLADTNVSTLTAISCGGQAFPKNLCDALRAQFPMAVLGLGYGMTETNGAISQAAGEAYYSRPDASGQVLPMMEVRVVDDNGKDLPLGEAGEIYVRGATVMQGYYNREDETAKTFDNGWLKTGDIGYLDAEDFVYIVDRKTDMVISAGENIYCAEIEKTLSKHPDLSTVVAFGVPDDRLGEKLIAGVLIRTSEVSIEDVEAYAKEVLADYKVPKEFMALGPDLETNVMGKVNKKDIRALFLSKS